MCSARDLAKYCASPLITWLDHYVQDHPEHREILIHKEDADDPNVKHWMEEGLKHEAAYLQALKDGKFREHFPHLKSGQPLSIVEIPKMETEDWKNLASHESRYQATLAAMAAGQDVIYQAYLRSEDGVFFGFVDFLVKVPNPPGVTSRFGDYHYEAWDTKLAKKEKIDYMIQLSCYADMLADMQGLRPENFSIVNGDSQKLDFRMDQYFATYENIRDSFVNFLQELETQKSSEPLSVSLEEGAEEEGDAELALEANLENLPIIPKAQGYGRYTTFVLDLLRRRDALTYVAGINNYQIFKLARVGIKTMTALSEIKYETDAEGILRFYRYNAAIGEREILEVDMDDVTLKRLVDQAEIQVLTLGRLKDLPGIDPSEISILRQSGINYIKDLSLLAAEQSMDGIESARLTELVQWAKDYIEANGLTKPLYKVLPPSADNPHSGLALLPPKSKNDTYTDFEWLPGKDGWTYLFMAIYDDPKTGEIKRKAFWAYSKEQEKEAFEAYIDWLYKRFREDPQMHAYHFTAAEPSVIKRLSQKYGTRIREVSQMFRKHTFVDSFQIMKQSMLIGSYSYGMKKIEPIFMGPRQAPVKSATESIFKFQEWLDHPDGKTVADSKILQGNEDYCGEDNLGQRGHVLFLRAEQQKLGITYNPAKPPKDNDPSDKEQLEKDDLRQKLRDLGHKLATRDPAHPDPQAESVAALLSAFVDYHEREASVVFQAKYRWAAMNKEELVADLATLGALEFIQGSEKVQPGRRKTLLAVDALAKSQEVYEGGQESPLTALPVNFANSPTNTRQFSYEFDPQQMTKLGLGDRCFLASDLEVRCEITAIDYKQGHVTLKFGPKAMARLKGQPPQDIALIPDEFVSTKTIQEAILRQLKKLIPDHEGKVVPLPPAIIKLLRGELPEIEGHQKGEPILARDLDEASLTPAISKAVANLKGSTLVIQGPPGTGKSYQGSKAIVHLIKKARAEGRKIKIGITANSHLSGLNLAEMVSKELQREGLEPHIAKVGDGYGSIDTENLPEGIVFRKNVDTLFSRPRSKNQVKLAYEDLEILVGTAWTFANQDLEGELDYLFVDDASQVGDANLFAMGQSLKRPDAERGTSEHGNIVLLGDHRQLGQPSRAGHPDGADKTAIEHYLNGKNVIPPEKGVFLKKTWRNHSSITRVYSDQIYEGQVISHPDNDKQKINQPRQKTRRRRLRYINKEAGFIHVPVPHFDNIHKSEEEVEIISKIIDELQDLSFTDREGNTRRITKEDIMVVAPYNLQTRHLARALGDRAQVGTIDKFQGREAPVVILSMSASQIHPSSPLMRFEFDERRLNVAISRAQALAIVVGSPDLKTIRPRTPEQMRRLNLYHLMTKKEDTVDSQGQAHLRQNVPGF